MYASERDFADVPNELSAWLDARAWTTGDGPEALFDAAAGWLREHWVLLPGRAVWLGWWAMCAKIVEISVTAENVLLDTLVHPARKPRLAPAMALGGEGLGPVGDWGYGRI